MFSTCRKFKSPTPTPHTHLKGLRGCPESKGRGWGRWWSAESFGSRTAPARLTAPLPSPTVAPEVEGTGRPGGSCGEGDLALDPSHVPPDSLLSLLWALLLLGSHGVGLLRSTPPGARTPVSPRPPWYQSPWCVRRVGPTGRPAAAQVDHESCPRPGCRLSCHLCPRPRAQPSLCQASLPSLYWSSGTASPHPLSFN